MLSIEFFIYILHILINQPENLMYINFEFQILNFQKIDHDENSYSSEIVSNIV